MTTPKYYTVQDVANIYGVTTWTIRRLVREGILTCLQLSPRVRRFTDKDLNDFEQRTRPNVEVSDGER